MMEGDHVESNLEKVKNQLEENLNKVRSQPWAQPLSTALETTGKLLGLIEGFVPGGKIIGGALSFAATLLDPQSPGFDVQTGLGQVEAGIHTDIERIFTEVESSNKNIAEEMTKTKDIIVDANFKVRQFSVSPLDGFFAQDGLQKVEAAYDVFLQNGLKDFQPFSFELQTCATQHLDPQRVRYYLEHKHQNHGLAVCQV